MVDEYEQKHITITKKQNQWIEKEHKNLSSMVQEMLDKEMKK